MSYTPQPGTIPHRALMWLRSMDKVRPGHEPTTAEFCEGLEIETYGFAAYMRLARERGSVHTRKVQTGNIRELYWRLGDGTPDPVLVPPPIEESCEVPLVEYKVPKFRVTTFRGAVLVTGMRVIRGVAVFTPEEMWQIKQHTDSAYSGVQAGESHAG